MGEKKFRIRARILLFILSIWAVVMTARLFYYTVYARDTYCEYGDRLAWRKGAILASRGKILSKDGIVLAWSERLFSLYLTNLSEYSSKLNGLREELNMIIGDFHIESEGDRYLIRESLSPKQISKLNELSKTFRTIKITPFFKRCQYRNKHVFDYIGEVKTDDGKEIGISGIEQKFNERLTGSDGEYKVMLDRQRQWIPKTWSLLTEMTAGENITLDLTLKQIIEKEDKE